MIGNSRKNIIKIVIPILYFALLIIVGSNVLPSAIMALALFVTLYHVYDHTQSAFTMSNIICVVGFYIGYFLRFFISIANPSRLTDFAPYPLTGDVGGHIKTSLVFLAFIVFYAFAFQKTRRRSIVWNDKSTISDSEDIINNQSAVILYVCIFVMYNVYKIFNSRMSTQLDYGIYDQFFRLFGFITKIFAYAHLYLFSRRKKKSNLIFYLMYIIPTLYNSFVQAWKGSILIEILILCIIFQTGLKKIKKRYIVLVTLGLLVVFPVVSMMRDYYRYGTSLNYSLTSIVNYNINHNILDYYLDRFEYYDGTYYAINVSPSIVAEYKAAAGSIIGRFFSGMIPRMIWHNKPVVNVGSYVTYVLLRYPRSTYNNLTVGLLADAYLDSKMLGIIGIALLMGVLVGRNENRNRSKDILMQSYYIVMGQSLFGFLEGDIAANMLGIIFVVMAYYICKIICTGKISIIKRV